MKRIDYMISASVILLSMVLLSGCSRHEVISVLEDEAATVFHAVAESGTTRTVLENGDSETESHPVLWTPGDTILVATASASGRYVYEGSANSEYADFEGTTLHGNLFYSLYPYSSIAGVSADGVLSFEMPSTQSYSSLSFGPGASPMVARSPSTTLEFKNLCGLLKLNLLGEATIKSIAFSANDAEGNAIKVSGHATVDMDYSSVPELVMASDANTSVILDCGEGIELNSTSVTPFYLVLPPGTYNQFTISIVSVDGKIMTKNSSNLVINRSVVKPTAELVFEPDSDQPGDREALIAFYNAVDGPNWINSTNWCTDEPLDTWYGITTDANGRVTGISMRNNLLSGDAGNTLAPLDALASVDFGNNYNESKADYNRLTSLDMSGNGLLVRLECADNDLSSLDVSQNIHLTYLNCNYNRISSLDVSAHTELRTLSCWSNSLSSLDISNCTKLTYLDCEQNSLSLLDVSNNLQLLTLYCSSNNLSSLDVGNNTQLENLYCYDNTISELDLSLNRQLISLYCFYNKLQLLDIRNNPNLEDNVYLGCQFNESGTGYRNMVLLMTEDQLMQWNNTWSGISYNSNVTVSSGNNPFVLSESDITVPKDGDNITVQVTFMAEYTVSSIPFWITESGRTVSGNVAVHNFSVAPNTGNEARSGEIVFTASDGSYSDAVSVYQKGGLYESKDYSADGTSVTLQSATVGNGIDIVLMGDAYSDRLIADGTYRRVMENTMEQFFSEEPYRSFRSYFNVYMVNVVSPNEGYEEGGKTALGTWFGNGTSVGGNDQKAFSYALKAISSDRLDEALLVVMMNRDYYAGTCWMYYPYEGDYGNGVSVAYFPTSSDTDTFRGLILHEAGGHGFSKLADEYAYESMGQIPPAEVTDCRNMWDFGWYRNIDFTSDLTLINWAHFISDDRYRYDGLGAFEGGYTYWTGVWRPTEYSIMRYNDGGYNAPSRELIYIRIHKLAFGENWQYDYEDFVAYDEINRRTSPQASPEYVRSFEPTAPPVIVRRNWREIMQE